MEKKILAGISVVFLVFGMMLAANAVLDGGRPDSHGILGNHSAMLQDLGLPKNATPQDVREAMFDKRIKDMGLTENSTIRELKMALREHMLKMLENMPSPPGNATFRRMQRRGFGPHETATLPDMLTVPNESIRDGCPMGHGGRMDEMMFGI